MRRPTGTVDSRQDQGRGARDVLSATATGASSARSHHRHAVLHVGRRGRAGDGVAADLSGRAAGASGAGSEAHHGAVWRTRSNGADARCSCAAAGGQVGGCAEDR